MICALKLKPGISHAELFQQVDACSGEIIVHTAEGDELNMKSQLSRYIFLAVLASDKRELLSRGTLEFRCDSDYDLLRDCLQTE